jgi:hypothetical protein
LLRPRSAAPRRSGEAAIDVAGGVVTLTALTAEAGPFLPGMTAGIDPTTNAPMPMSVTISDCAPDNGTFRIVEVIDRAHLTIAAPHARAGIGCRYLIDMNSRKNNPMANHDTPGARWAANAVPLGDNRILVTGGSSTYGTGSAMIKQLGQDDEGLNCIRIDARALEALLTVAPP